MHLWKYRTASVEAHAHRGMRLARVNGIVTPDTLRLVIADSAHWAGGGEHLAHVVDYGTAAMALDLRTMLDMAKAAKRSDAINAPPAAFIVGADQVSLFEDYTAAMQARGFLMAAFTDPEAGRRWAARQAQVREHWRGLHAGLRRSEP